MKANKNNHFVFKFTNKTKLFPKHFGRLLVVHRDDDEVLNQVAYDKNWKLIGKCDEQAQQKWERQEDLRA